MPNPPDTQKLPGLTFRMFRDASDCAAIESIAAAIKADGETYWLPESVDIEDLRANQLSRARCECLLAEMNGRAVGFTWLIDPDWYRKTRMYLLRACVVPQCQGKGVGRTMLRWQEERARDVAASDDYEGDKVFAAFAYEKDAGKRVLLEGEGYGSANTAVFMEHRSLEKISSAPPPSGIEIRPASSEHYDKVWDVLEACFNSTDENDGRAVSTITERNRRRYAAQPTCDLSLWRVAWDKDVVVGAALNRIEDSAGETDYLAVMPRWRRRGIAQAILTQSLIALRKRGITRSLIATEEDNSNDTVRLYESLGYRIYERRFCCWKPVV